MIDRFERVAGWLRPRRRWAAVLAGLVWATWAGSLILGDGTFDVTGRLIHTDHLAFYTPARLVREGRAADLYDHVKVSEYQAGLFPPGRWDALEAFRNPPFYALPYLPTAGLSYPASAWVWTAVSVAALVLGIHWLGASRPWTVVGWSLCFVPVFAVFNYGQNSLLSFAILAGTFRLLNRGHRFAAGLVAGLLWFKPPLLLGLIVWGLLDIRRLWPAAAGVIVTGLGLALGTYPLMPDAWDGFAGSLRENAAFNNFDQWKVHTPRAFWEMLLPGVVGWPTALWLLTAAAGVGAFVRVWRANRDDVPVLFGAATLLMLWVSPHALIYEWAVAVVPAVLWWQARPALRDSWLVLFAVVWAVLFVSTDAGMAQEWLQKRAGVERPIIVQLSVPVVGWVGWQVARLLTTGVRSRERTIIEPVPTICAAP